MTDAPPDTSGSRRDLLVVLVVAALVRLVAHAEMADAPHTFAPVIDSEAYLIQALRVAGGHDIVDGVYFQAPLYPWVLGGVLAASGHPGIAPGAETIADVPPELLSSALVIGRRFQALLGVALAGFVWWLSARLFGRRAALVAGLFAAGYGPLVFYEAHLLKVSLAVLFWPATVIAAVWALRGGRPRRFALVGALLGASALVRGNSQIVSALGLAVLLAAAWRAGRPREGLVRAAWWIGGLLLAMSPVFVRNTVVVGTPTVSTATPGTAFYLCNHGGNAVGMIEHVSVNRQVPRHEQADWQRAAEQRAGRELSPGEVSSFWFRAALDEIAADPGRYLLAETRKAAMLFSRYEAPDNTMVALGDDVSAFLRWTPLRYGTLIPLALAGFVVSWRRRRAAGARGEAALVVALVGYAGSLLLFTAVSRFRIPLAPLLMPYAGLGAVALATSARDRRPALAALVVGVGLTFVSELPWPGPLDDEEQARHLSVRLLNRAQVAFSLGDEEQGIADLERAIDVAAAAGTSSPTLYATLAGHRRGQAARAAAAGDASGADALRAEAVALLEEAFEIDPDHGPANREAGLLDYEARSFERAIEHFEKAVEAVPGDRVSRVYAACSALAEGDVGTAERYARELVDDWPTHDDGWGILALAFASQGRRADALDAVATYEELVASRVAAGYTRRLDDLHAAALHTSAGASYRLKARAAQAAGDDAGADALRARSAAQLKSALAVDPDHGPANREAGLLLYETGNDAGALVRLEAALAADPTDRVTRLYAALAGLGAGDAQRAEDHARVLVDEWPEHDDGHGILALALHAQGELDAARAAVERYDELAAQREAAGYRRRLDDQPVFDSLRSSP